MIVEYCQGGVGVKKTANVFPLVLYTLGHAVLISLGAVCFLNVAAITLSPFGSTGSYPRFLPFCVIVGLTALLVWMYLIFCNARHLLNPPVEDCTGGCPDTPPYYSGYVAMG